MNVTQQDCLHAIQLKSACARIRINRINLHRQMHGNNLNEIMFFKDYITQREKNMNREILNFDFRFQLLICIVNQQVLQI